MIITLSIVGLYLLCGIAYTLWAVISEGWDWDIAEGWFSLWIAYPLAIGLWWLWMYRYLRR